MDRRAALKKLSVGGAIAAGGSMVLSSTNVAYAVSGPVEVPTATWVLPSSNRKVMNLTVTAPAPSCGTGSATPSYAWLAYSGPPNSQKGPVSNGGRTIEFNHTTASDKFDSGEVVQIALQIIWSCPGSPATTANYTVTVNVTGALSGNASVVA